MAKKFLHFTFAVSGVICCPIPAELAAAAVVAAEAAGADDVGSCGVTVVDCCGLDMATGWVGSLMGCVAAGTACLTAVTAGCLTAAAAGWLTAGVAVTPGVPGGPTLSI